MTDQPSFGNSFRRAVLTGERRILVMEDKQPRRADGAMVSRGEIRRSDHRGRDRHRLNGEKATASYKGKKRKVEVVNLSSGGAMIRARFIPKLWALIELELGDGPGIECAVRWLRDGLIGLEFAHETRIECDPETRARLLLEVIQRSFPDVAVELDPIGEAVQEQPSRNEEEALGKRSESRHPLIWKGQILYSFDSHPARIRNISTGGALIDVEVDYPVGAEVMLDLGEAGHIDSVVSWIAGGHAGLKFKQPFDLELLASQRPDLTPHRWIKPAFLDGNSHDCTPWDPEWSRLSLTELQERLEGFLKH